MSLARLYPLLLSTIDLGKVSVSSFTSLPCLYLGRLCSAFYGSKPLIRLKRMPANKLIRVLTLSVVIIGVGGYFDRDGLSFNLIVAGNLGAQSDVTRPVACVIAHGQYFAKKMTAAR